MWQITWSSTALRDLIGFGHNVGERVSGALVRAVQSGRGDLRHLHGMGDEWRLRVGEYRVRFAIDRETHTVTVLHVFKSG